MNGQSIALEQLWDTEKFTPNPAQREAILHVEGPLYLPAGPGSGKTRVLLWRTLYLIVFHSVTPDTIYLSTFTEKAAHQLKDGLRALLGLASNLTGQPYDISQMYVGTVHALCQRLILDRRFYPHRQRGKAPLLVDELGQYFYLYHTAKWTDLTQQAGFEDANARINALFDGSESSSRHRAVMHCIAFFNRLSEECLDPDALIPQADDPVLAQLIRMYALYRDSLRRSDVPALTDFSLLQQNALRVLEAFAGSGHVFQHVIVDEYQDTNTVQERIFFRLAAGSKNICVVGDDDQALYRFRGATVENLVEFPDRCATQLGVTPRTITLATNYRSRCHIVDFYTRFIGGCDWRRPEGGFYRVASKDIQAHIADRGTAVVASTPASPEVACAEIAELVRQLLEAKLVEDPNQIAFLFPSLKSHIIQHMKEALEERGLRVYAPRAGRFLEVDEAVDMFGLFLHVFGQPERGDFGGADYREFHDWLDAAQERGQELRAADRRLDQYVKDRQREIETAMADYQILTRVAEGKGWDLRTPYGPAKMKRALYEARGLSETARRNLGSMSFEKVVQHRLEEGRPFSLNYVLTSATALDWSVLDLFYRLCGFDHFRQTFDLAERGEDEGPICNLGLISQYLARFMDEYVSLITAPLLQDEGLVRLFFSTYLFALFRRGESEYEYPEDPFPRGRIPFLTIHQAKGLEFPVVVLGNPRKDSLGPQRVEELVHPFLHSQREPLERMGEFDTMRLFYVALSRAKNLLVIAHFKGKGQHVNEPFKTLLDDEFPRIPQLDVAALPQARLEEDETPHSYSYTGDYLFYQKCPRQYMIFRQYGFVPSRSQTQMFGSLIHRTLEDLHQYLISQRTTV
jgi:DNA helicase-2/ATP-dependent DNA helicase PcrA